MGGCVQNSLVSRQKIAAGCSPDAGAHQLSIAGREIEDIFLITLEGVAGGLENKTSFIEGKISFRILAAESQLSNSGEVTLSVDEKFVFLR